MSNPKQIFKVIADGKEIPLMQCQQGAAIRFARKHGSRERCEVELYCSIDGGKNWDKIDF